METRLEALGKMYNALSLANLKVLVGIEHTSMADYETPTTYVDILFAECEIWFDVAGWVVLENDAVKLRVKLSKTSLVINDDGIVILIEQD